MIAINTKIVGSLLALIGLFVLPSCSQMEVMNMLGLGPTPEMTKDINYEPFEKVANKAFQEKLKNSYFKFRARYFGTVPNPGEMRRVKGYVNIKLCDVQRKSVCTNTAIVRDSDAEQLFSLNDGQVIEMVGSIIEGMGVSTSAGNIYARNMPGGHMGIYFIKIHQIISKPTPGNAGNPPANLAGERTTSDTSPSTSSFVRAAQKKLSDLGYAPGPVDGIMGPKTRRAIRQYQRDHELAITGELNEATLKGMGIK